MTTTITTTNAISAITSEQQQAAVVCIICYCRGRTAANLKQHNMFKHSLDTFKKKHQCDLCNYTCATKDNIIAHYARAHHDRQRAADLIATTNGCSDDDAF
jgi:hypothetical protein